MDFFEAVEKRYSVRSFQKKEMEGEKLGKILAAANSAPSAGNLQAFEIVLVKNTATKKKLAMGAFDQDFIAEAPVVLVVFANEARSSVKYGRRGKELYCVADACIAAGYVQLAACALQLGSCWVGAFDDDEVRRILHAPAHLRPVAILPIGEPADEPEQRERRELPDIVHEERF